MSQTTRDSISYLELVQEVQMAQSQPRSTSLSELQIVSQLVSNKFQELNDSNNKLHSSITDMNNSITDMNNSITDMNNSITDMNNSIKNMNKNINCTNEYFKVLIQQNGEILRILKNNLQDDSKYFNTSRFGKIQNFTLIREIGSGKFGTVFLAIQKYTGFVLSIKRIDKNEIVKSGLTQQIVRQIKIQSSLNHPNIAKLYGFFSDSNYIYLLMELGCDGQLYKLISEKKKGLSQQATSFLLRSLLEAAQHIHQKKIIHRDIKPENIVLTMGQVKICDFGWATTKKYPLELKRTFCGTPLYFSPQMLTQQRHYDQKVDIWSLGIIAYEVLFSHHPFQIRVESDLIKIVYDPIQFHQNEYASKWFKTLILSMLEKDPNQRPSAQTLLNAKFIKNYQQIEVCSEFCQ